MKSKFTRLQSILLLIVSMSLFLGSQSWAATSAITQEQAKLLGKFATNVTWPDDAIKSEFVIGVYRDTKKHEDFSNYFANKTVKGKDIAVRLVKTMNQAKKTNILYISDKEKDFITLAHLQMNGSSVLMVTEDSDERFKTMIDISYNKQQSKIVFRINDSNIVNTPLTVPDISVLLSGSEELALKDTSNDSSELITNSESSTTDQALVQNEFALQNQLTQQKETLEQLTQQLKLNKETYDLQLAQEAKKLKVEKSKNTKNSKKLKTQQSKLKSLEKKLKNQKLQMTANKESDQNEQAQEHELAISLLNEQIEKQNIEISNTETQMATLIEKQKNESSSSFKILFFMFLIIAIAALIVAYLMWKKSEELLSKPQTRIEPVIPPVTDKNSSLLPIREGQLIKSENYAALGYIATDITYAVGLALSDLHDELLSANENKNVEKIKPLLTLLENFNNIAADQDDTEFQTFDLVAYMKNMMMLYNFEFEQSDIIYNYSGESELTIKSIPSYIALVLLNLINNSLKHAFDNNGNGIINLNVKKLANGGATITYSDDGTGMNKKTLEKVFTPFFTTQEKRGYVGAGMTTSHELITNKLDGSIELESTEGKGTKVIITLP